MILSEPDSQNIKYTLHLWLIDRIMSLVVSELCPFDLDFLFYDF